MMYGISVIKIQNKSNSVNFSTILVDYISPFSAASAFSHFDFVVLFFFFFFKVQI
ncbi:hypothetical protein Hanom_Chr17g01573891 [Helianthus anomalus]